MNEDPSQGKWPWLQACMSGLALLLGLLGVVVVVYGWCYPAVDVGVIVRGVLIVAGLGIAAAAAVPLAILALLRRRRWDTPVE